MPTTPQLKRLFALARNAGLTPDEVKGIVAERYGHASRRDLSDREYEELCVHLQEVSGDRSAASGRRKAGELANPMEILAWLNEKPRLPWDAVALTEHDVTTVMTLLDDFRVRRDSYLRISVAQARRWLGWWGRYPLSAWREAAGIWLSCYRSRLDLDETYFQGILRKVARRAGLAA